MASLYTSMSYDEYYPYRGTIGKGNMAYSNNRITGYKPYKGTIGIDDMKYKTQPFKGSINPKLERSQVTRPPRRTRQPTQFYERTSRRAGQGHKPYRHQVHDTSKYKPYESNIRWKARQEPFQGYQPKSYKGEMVDRPYKPYQLPEDYYGFKRRERQPNRDRFYIPPQAAPVHMETSIQGPLPKRKTPPRHLARRNSPPVKDPLTEINRGSRTPVYNMPPPAAAAVPVSRKPLVVSPPPPPHHKQPSPAAIPAQPFVASDPIAVAPRPQKSVKINQVEPQRINWSPVPVEMSPRPPVRAPQRHPVRMSDPISPFPPATPPPDSMFQSRLSPDRLENLYKPKPKPMFPPLVPLNLLDNPKGVMVATVPRMPSPSWAASKPNGNPLIPVISGLKPSAKMPSYPEWSMPDYEHWEYSPRYSKLPDYNAAGSVLRSSALYGY